MITLEKIITAVIIFFFVYLILSLRFNNVVEVYDCSQLHKHYVVPNQIIEECFNTFKSPRLIST